MKQLEALLPKAARAGVPILVVGETGTGKELVARALHDLSPRADGPFIALNCAAVPSNLLESELFGHVRGAFTDAKRAREGLFVQANGGTLLLDEIGELPLPLQPKLLRALQERRLRPVGGSTEVAFDCSIVTATNRDLRTEIRTGGFREDLFYRVNVIQLDVPPLRVRGADILLLAQHFLGAARLRRGGGPAGITTAAARALLAHSWPGNVRELENCMQRAVAMAEHNQLLLSDLPEQVRSSRPLGEGAADCGLCPLEEVERRHIERVLEAMGGNRSAAAKILRIDRKTLYRKLDRWERG